jgi:hypothetical protein
MTAFSINYDLKAPGRNYNPLYDEIKRSSQWWHFLESTWLIATSETIDQISYRLRRHIDKNDFLLVIEIRNNKQGQLPKEAWEWINVHVPG